VGRGDDGTARIGRGTVAVDLEDAMQLYRFEYSCYARKVQMALDLLAKSYAVVDVPYGDRSQLVAVTGGYVQVPVLVDAAGVVRFDSRAICVHLVSSDGGATLVPSPWEGPIWAYADWCDGPLEDVLFRLASPGLRARFERAVDRAMFTFVKERKFGRGCVEEWARQAEDLLRQARELLQPTVRTLEQQPFVFGTRPTLADAALYGQCAMLAAADPAMPAALSAVLAPWTARLEDIARSTQRC
jgi:glutathione S-transferase